MTEYECSYRSNERCYPNCTTAVATEGRCLTDRKRWTDEMEKQYFITRRIGVAKANEGVKNE